MHHSVVFVLLGVITKQHANITPFSQSTTPWLLRKKTVVKIFTKPLTVCKGKSKKTCNFHQRFTLGDYLNS